MLAESRHRMETIKSLKIFDVDIFYRDVVRPLLEKLGISWSEFRMRNPVRKSTATFPPS
jgi:hypothetical protein